MSRSPMRIFRAPLVIAAASLAGLVSALVADGVWDALSWLTLGGSVGVGAWHALRRGSGDGPAASRPALSTSDRSAP